MKLLSESYDMKDTFSQEQFFRIMEGWLKKANVTKELGEKLEAGADKASFHAEKEYCRLDTMCYANDSVSYTALKLEQDFRGTTWTTEAILEAKGKEQTVYIHISCSGEDRGRKKVNPLHRQIIRELMASGSIKDQTVPFSSSPIEVSDENMQWVASAMQSGYTDDVPVVIVSQCFNSYGYDVNVDQLAKDFYGIAYIVTADYDYTNSIKGKYGLRPPYGGAVAIYQNGRLLKQYQKDRDSYYGYSLDSVVEDKILYTVTTNSEKAAPTWESIYSDINKAESEHLSELVSMFDDSNMDMNEKLRIAREKIEELYQENVALQHRNASLQAALSAKAPSANSLLIAGDEKDLYEGEQHDLIISILTRYLSTSCAEGTRPEELLKSILAKNSLNGAGKKIFDEVSRILSASGNLTSKDISDLERIGFSVISENTHYKLIFKDNPKYSFSFSKTPSDVRTGRNAVADILSTLSVYK